ncbi:MAG: phospho-sugar mutase [Nostocoides sp.]
MDADHGPLLQAAATWAADDPDPVTRAEVQALIAAADSGDAAAEADLADRFAGLLQFGTAGLRGALGGGPNRMNRAVVMLAAAGLTAYLRRTNPQPYVVLGYDGRVNSDVFARDTAAVVTAAGGRAAVLPKALPTPVLAYAVQALGADAGVMVTASHNPPQDNGYKVYLNDGAQIAPPVDREIAAEIGAIGSVAQIPRARDGWETLDDDVLEAYLADVAAVVSASSPRNITVVHTALHGVGSETVRRAFVAAGFPPPVQVAAQAEPDPTFPTLAFPNPEEPGAMDAALNLAEQTGPDLVIANDPDADRCAVAIPTQAGWRVLRGDEVGVLLGVHLIERGRVSRTSVVATSIVSSGMLGVVCRAAGVEHVRTLTGFKWIARVPRLAYGYEEALGYCVDPERVRDKDGVCAALLIAELAAQLKAQGRTLAEKWDDLAREHGVYATDAFAVRVEDLSLLEALLGRLRDAPPTRLAGFDVASVEDLEKAHGQVPPTPGLRITLSDGSWVIVRPSGTEPKLKVYLEVVEAVHTGDLSRARRATGDRLTALRTALEQLTDV